MKTAADRGESARMVATIRESTRQLVADRIKAGGSLDGEIGRAAQVQAPAPRDKDRSRYRLHRATGISPIRVVHAGLFCDRLLSNDRAPHPSASNMTVFLPNRLLRPSIPSTRPVSFASALSNS